jgi:MoxR-like ATPase
VDEQQGATARKAEDIEAVEKLAKARQILLREIHKVIIGQDKVIEQLFCCLFARGHCLMIGVPGLAKTLMISTLAQVLKLVFHRIQFTPDLMPSDITGTEIIDEDKATGKRSFRFVRGPIFANIILADEINRTPPKTQAALLQSMQEYQVSSAGVTHDLELPFFVLATQNPIEQEGTYPLPEAQLDRFMFSVIVDYPSRSEEHEIVKSTTYDIQNEPQAVLRGSDILAIQKIVRRVPVSDHVVDYAVNLVRATRPKDPTAPQFAKDWLSWGAGPRACQYLILGAKALVILHGRYNVTCNDIRTLAIPVMRHRMFTNFNADAEGVDVEDIIRELIKIVPEPSEEDYAKKPQEAKAAAS